MPNYNKSFNFRNGVQVDVDDLIVRGNLVGIGTTIPRADLDVRGIVDVIGIVTTSNLFVSGVSTFANELHIGTGITISPQTGIISASFRGDGSFLDNLPTSQWSNDGSGGIYNGGPVGVGTTNATQTFQVGGNPDNPLHFGVGIDSARGNIRTTGIITAASFVGSGLGITAITADNITSGNLDSARLPTSFFGLGEIGATNLAISGVGTVATINSTTGTITTLSATNATVSNDLNVGGALTATSVNVSGASTFASIDIDQNNGRLRLGPSEQLQIYVDTNNSYIEESGTGSLFINSNEVRFRNAANSENIATFNSDGAVDLYYNNSKRFETTGVGATVIGKLQVSSDSSILGISTLTSISASDATIGVSTLTNVTATDIAVQKLTVSGVTTFAAAVDANAGATIDNIQIGISDDNEIDTASGNLTIDSAGGTTTIDDDVAITGTLTVSSGFNPITTNSVGLGTAGTVYSNAFISDITVGAAASNTISTRNESLTLDSTQGTVVVQDDFNVTGVTTLTSLTAATATVSTNLLPSSDKSAGIGTNGTAFSEGFFGEITIGSASDNTVSSRSGSLLLDSTQGTVVVQDDFNVTGVTTLTSLTVDSSLVPTSDKSNGIGAVNRAFSNAFVGEVTVGAASSNKVSTRGGSLLLDSTQGTVIVQDDFNVTGVSTLPTLNSTTITSTNINASTTLSPVADKTVPLGSSSLRYSELYVDNIRVGVGSDQEIKAQTGNLEIDAPFGRVRVNNLTPVGIVTFAGDISLDGDKTRNLGSGTNALASGHIGEVRIANGTNDNTIDTRTGELTLNSADSRVIVGSGLSAPSLDITNNILVGSGSTSFAVLSGVQNVGIGTSIPSSSIQVVKHSSANLQLISKTASSEIVLASELGITDDSASITYDGTDLTIANKDSGGDILVDMSTGTGINTSSEFKIKHGGSDLFVVSHDGLLGINKSVPTKELDIVGDLAVSNNAVITGILTIGTGGNQLTLGSANTLFVGNIDTSNSSGVSTITTLNSTSITSGNINSSGIITAVTGNFTGNISVGNTGTFNNGTFLVGGTIGTDTQTSVASDGGDVLTVKGATSIRGSLFAAYAGGDIGTVGIGTTNYPTDERDTGAIGNLVQVDYGNFSHTGSMSVVGEEDNGTCIFVPSKNVSSVPTLKKNNTQSEFSWTREFKVGINTHVPRSAFDIGACNSPMIVPSLSQQSITELVTTPNNATMTDPALSSGSGIQVIGGLFFSKPENRLKVGLATANSEDSYVGILTATTNSSAFEAVSFPQMTTTNRNTMNTAGGIPDGSVIYNTTTNKLQVKAGGSFVDLH